MKNKKLLVLGAGRGHLGVFKTAKRMGIETVLATLPGEHPCNELADKICIGDITKPHEMLKIAEKEKVDGIIICCSDKGLKSVGVVCDTLKSTGITEKAAIFSTNKFLMKERLVEKGVRTARFKKVASTDDVTLALKYLQLPVIIKVTDLQGSKGIYIANNYTEAIDSFEKAISETKLGYCLIEEFIEGLECGAQAFVYNGEILFVLPHGDETFMTNTPVPIGHFIPFSASKLILDEIYEQTEKSIRALELDNCAINLDFIVKENKAYIIELTGRVGANCLPELVSVNFGIDYYSMIITMAIGSDPKTIFRNKQNFYGSALAKMLISKNDGIIEEFKYTGEVDMDIYDMTFFAKKGTSIRKFLNSNDCIGQIVVKGESIESCNKKINNIQKKITIKTKS